MAEYLLPDVGEGLTEAEIVAWKVKVGDVIAVNDIVVEIETAKSLVELPSPYAGTVTAILVEEGTTVAVGTPIIAVGDAADASGAAAPAEPTDEMEIDLSNPAASGGGEGESLVGRNKADRGPTRRPRKVASGTLATHIQAQASFETGLASPLVEAAEPEESVPAYGVVEQRATGDVETSRALAKPPVRKLAKDLGIDLATVTRHRAERVGHPRRPRGCRRRARAAQARGRDGRSRDPRADQGRPQDDGRRDDAVGVHGPARHRVGHHRRHPDHGVRRPAQEAPRVPRGQGVTAAGARAGLHPGDAAYAGDQLVLGRGRRGGRAQALRQPRHRRGDPARTGRAQRQGGAGPVAGRPGRGPQRPDRRRPRGEDAAGRDERRDLHDHQRRGLRRRRGHPDHQPGRVRDPVLRRDQEAAVGGRRRRSSSVRSRRWRCPSTTGTSTARRAHASWPTWPASSRTRLPRCCSELCRASSAQRSAEQRQRDGRDGDASGLRCFDHELGGDEGADAGDPQHQGEPAGETGPAQADGHQDRADEQARQGQQQGEERRAAGRVQQVNRGIAGHRRVDERRELEVEGGAARGEPDAPEREQSYAHGERDGGHVRWGRCRTADREPSTSRAAATKNSAADSASRPRAAATAS